MTDVLLQALGAATVVLALVDVFYTVLFPASGHGPLRKPLSIALRSLFSLSRHLKSADRRRRVLSYAGPVQIAVTLLVWFSLLLVGWAAVYRPALGSGVAAAQGHTKQGWGTALYVSGYALTTLGTGGVAPQTGAYRLLTVIEAATGFAITSLVISYFNSVFTTLVGRNAFALAVHQRSSRTGRGEQVVTALWREGEAAAALHLSEMAAGLRAIAQSHRAYPVLRSFHYRQDYDALPRMLLTCLETSTLLRTTVDLDAARATGRTCLGGSSVAEIEDAARAVSAHLVPSGRRAHPSDDQRRSWAERHHETLSTLTDAGVPVLDEKESAEAYMLLRAQWNAQLAELADALLYDWGPASTPRP